MVLTDYKSLVPALASQVGVQLQPPISGVDAFMPLIEKMRADGAVTVLKVDGERKGDEVNGPYTAIVSGQVLEGEFFRVDASSIEDALAYVIVNYAERCWGFDPSV